MKNDKSYVRRMGLMEKQKEVGRKLSRKSKKFSKKIFNPPKENGVYEMSTGVWERK